MLPVPPVAVAVSVVDDPVQKERFPVTLTSTAEAGSVMVIVSELVVPLASVTITVYDPAERLEMDDVVKPVGFQTYV